MVGPSAQPINLRRFQMKLSHAIESYQKYHSFNSEKNTIKNYEFLFTRFNDEFGKRDLESITPDETLSFLTRLTEGNNQTTKRNRYSSLKAFFNYIRNTIDFVIKNPCDTPILKKLFREKRPQQWKIIEKDLIDEIIFKTTNPRNRIMMELMAKGGMRIGE